MYYEINVAKDGHHFFATHERSISTTNKLKKVYEKFVEAFPESEGYSISITEKETIGRFVNIEELIKS